MSEILIFWEYLLWKSRMILIFPFLKKPQNIKLGFIVSIFCPQQGCWKSTYIFKRKTNFTIVTWLWERENTVIIGHERQQHRGTFHSVTFILSDSPFTEVVSSSTSLCTVPWVGNSANISLPPSNPLLPALQGSAPSQSCASHIPFTAQQEPATGGTSKCQGWELLCLRANENNS